MEPAVFIALLACVPGQALQGKQWLLSETPVSKSNLAAYLAGPGIKEAQEVHQEKLTRAKEKLDAAKRGKKTGKERQKAIDDAKVEVANLDGTKIVPLAPRLPQASMSLGDVGRLLIPVEVTQVIGPNKILASSGIQEFERTFVLSIPTARLVDGQKFSTGDICFEVTGKVTHKTVLGASRTLWELKPIDLAEFIQN